MSTHDNAAPLDGWVCEPRPCPNMCRPCEQPAPALIPANIILGTE